MTFEEIIFAENLKIYTFTILSILKGNFFQKIKKRHWLGPGFKTGLFKKCGTSDTFLNKAKMYFMKVMKIK